MAKLLKKIPEEAKWCLDRSIRLSFREFIEKWSKSIDNTKIRDDYKNWTSTADYIRFWSTRSQSNTLLKTELGCSEIINIVTEQRLKSLQTTAASNGASSGNSSALNVSSNYFVPEVSDNSPDFDISDDSSAPNEPTSLTNTMLIEVKDYLVSVMKNFVNEEDRNDNPWMFEDINISHLFRKYQAATSEILVKHKTLPVESYVNELASLTHILFLCKDQHSDIAEKGFELRIQKLSTRPINDYKQIGETELWSTYFDPLLSCLISDPDLCPELRSKLSSELRSCSSRSLME
ncbi:hypothetical protein INT47_001339 [Mucor saturninus]|uniref:Uncharacterized protein n=1 Tax=Mucor saturninus TaxID=64648 RepID=A0A8H7QY42_9FUNG|nr:hypothetical protein INT47_001339 [Mucor saturninus]